MAANTVFTSHVGAGGSTPQSRAAAAGFVGRVSENIVGGTGMTAARGLNLVGQQSGSLQHPHHQPLSGCWHRICHQWQRKFLRACSRPTVRFTTTTRSRHQSRTTFHHSQLPWHNQAKMALLCMWCRRGRLFGRWQPIMKSLYLICCCSTVYQPMPSCSQATSITIRLAEGQAPPPTPTPPTMHTVLDGQSLWSIAVQYNVKLGDILWLNQLPEDAILQPGELVRVRLAPDEAPPPTPTPILYHSVRSGQTLWEIAITYGLTLDDLLALNQIDQDKILQLGDLLLVRQVQSQHRCPHYHQLKHRQPQHLQFHLAQLKRPRRSARPFPALSQSILSPHPPHLKQLLKRPFLPNPSEEKPTIIGIVTILIVGFLVVGLVAIVVLRRELI